MAAKARPQLHRRRPRPPYGDQPKGKPTGWFQDEARILDKFNLAARHQARLPLRTGTPPGHAGSTSRNDAALK